jgi:C4-dicarboxylate-specific signal transduction histidine kinase
MALSVPSNKFAVVVVVVVVVAFAPTTMWMTSWRWRWQWERMSVWKEARVGGEWEEERRSDMTSKRKREEAETHTL